MMFKKNILLLVVVYTIGSIAFANAIVENNNYIKRRSAIQSSSIRTDNINYSDNSHYNNTYNSAIEEIKESIKNKPNDYSLYASLVNLYIRTNNYNASIEELFFLNKLNKQNKITTDVREELNNIYNNLKSKLKYNQNKSLIYTNMALIMLINNNQIEAEKIIDNAATNASNPDAIASVLPLIYDSKEKIREAIEICNKIISKNPQSLKTKKIKADYLCEINEIDAAINEYKSIISINPLEKEIKYKLYKLLASKGHSEKEIVGALYTNNETKLDTAFYEIADMLLKHEDIEDAEYFATILAKNFPDNPNGYILLAEIYRKEGKLKESYEALNILRNKANTNEDIAKYNVLLAKLSDKPVNEANSLIANGLYQQALDLLSNANQDALYVILTQARANYLLNKKQTTLELLNKAMSFYPNNSDVYCAFGYIYLKENDINSARKYTNKSLEINKDNKTAQDLLNMVNKAEADKFKSQIISSYELQNYTETMRLINEALQINSKDAFLHFYKGLTHIAQNNYEASTADFYKTLQLEKNNYLAYFYLATVFDNLSETNNALENYQKFLKLVPKDAYEESEKINYAQTRIKQIKG